MDIDAEIVSCPRRNSFGYLVDLFYISYLVWLVWLVSLVSLVYLVYLVFLIFIIIILILIFVIVITQAAGVSVFNQIFCHLSDLSVFRVLGLPSVLSI